MAQLTPKDILDISEPIEAIYQRTVDELLINIAHHFTISGWERTRYWEIKKLSEMGALTKESAAIIAKNTNMLPSEIEKAFLQVSEKACLDIDPQLREAAAKGLLQNPATTPSTSVLMRQMVQGYVDQAVDTCNMVNTTMLESTRQVYLYGVQTAVNTATRKELMNTLEAGALGVVTGAETKVQAIRKAMNAVTAQGITGFIDKAGRKWSAEAYTSMVIRTTAHNAAIQSVKTRQQEYGGGDIFQVSSHPAARPLCFPYQGKFFSWSSAGEFKDGAGHTHKYDIITNSSYGEPAGLFGINCGHHPIPMIPNFSYPQDGPQETEAENAKEYEESQRQRAYEREIREAKRDLEIAKATGDTDAIKAAEQKVAQKQANMRAFTKETGRPRRYDREKIAGTKDIDGYKGYRAQFGSDIPLDKTASKAYNNRSYTESTSIDAAASFAESLGYKTFYGNIDLEVANAMNEALYDGAQLCPQISDRLKSVGSAQERNREFKAVLQDVYVKEITAAMPDITSVYTDAQIEAMAKSWASKTVGRVSGDTYAFAWNGGKRDEGKVFGGIFVNDKFGQDTEKFKASVARSVKTKWHPEGCESIKSVFDHEIGHQIDYALGLRDNPEMVKLYQGLSKSEIGDGLSRYAAEYTGKKGLGEFIAEGYAEYVNNPTPRDIATKIGQIIDEALKK